ncbi:MAG: Sec-independent protein translocase protein TatB [Acetobacter sp.]
MFDFAWSEIALIGAVALVVIGPRDLPVAMRGLAGLVKKARTLAGEFQSHVDDMVRDADLGDVRDQVRDLRNLNVRDRLMKALDSDGSLARATEPPAPLGERIIPAGPRALDRPAPAADGAGVSWPEPVRSVAPAWSGNDPYAPRSVPQSVVDSAPPELPPGIARRILREQDRLHPPAIVPPVRVMHGRRAVAPGRIAILPAADGDGEDAQPVAPPSMPLTAEPVPPLPSVLHPADPPPASLPPQGSPSQPTGSQA